MIFQVRVIWLKTSYKYWILHTNFIYLTLCAFFVNFSISAFCSSIRNKKIQRIKFFRVKTFLRQNVYVNVYINQFKCIDHPIFLNNYLKKKDAMLRLIIGFSKKYLKFLNSIFIVASLFFLPGFSFMNINDSQNSRGKRALSY